GSSTWGPRIVRVHTPHRDGVPFLYIFQAHGDFSLDMMLPSLRRIRRRHHLITEGLPHLMKSEIEVKLCPDPSSVKLTPNTETPKQTACLLAISQKNAETTPKQTPKRRNMDAANNRP